MDWKPKYKLMSEVIDADKGNYICLDNGKVVTSVSLKKSSPVGLGISYKRERHIFTSSDAPQNQPSARINRKTNRTLDRGIQLYRMWFRFLKLALELEEMGISLVTKNHTIIKNWRGANPPIPQNLKKKISGNSGTQQIFRCKRIQKIKVKRSAYKGWDLDEVLNLSFKKWWESHSHLFEGYYPQIISSKNEWIDDNNFVYVRIDKTSQWTDVSNFMSEKLSKVIKTEGRNRYKVSGTPRVNVCQNNYNALVLLIKGKSPKEICNDKKIYLRKTDEHINASRTKDKSLTIPIDKKGKPLYSLVVSKQREMGIHHLLEVCDGRFGYALKK